MPDKVIPLIYHRVYQDLQNLSEEKQAVYMKGKGIAKGDVFVVSYRFNPGRKRTVNKVFKEEIKGQVQSFELLKNN